MQIGPASGRAVRKYLAIQIDELTASGALTGTPIDLAEQGVGALLNALAKDRRPLIRRIVAGCARYYRHPRGVELVIRLAADTNVEVRVAAIESLGQLLGGRKACPPILCDRLQDRRVLVRIAAAEAIGQIGDRRVARFLRRSLEDRVPLVRSYAAAAIGHLGIKSDLRLLRRSAAKDTSPTALIGMLGATYQLGHTLAAIDGLTRLLTNRDYRVRCGSANTLSSFRMNLTQSKRVRESLQSRLAQESTVAAKEAIARALKRL